MLKKIVLVAAIFAAMVSPAAAQSSTGKATTAAPSYLNNSNSPLSLDLAGNLRVVNGGSPTGTQDVNITAVGGTPVTSPLPVDVQNTVTVGGTVDQGTAGTDPWVINLTDLAGTPITSTVPGALDITCVSGCVAGSGVSQGTATTAAPTYITGTNNPLSLDLAGNLRVLVGNTSIPVTQSGTWNVGTVTAVTSITNPVTVVQTTAANLNATVVGTGTFAVQAAQSGTWNIGTVATITNPVAVTQSGAWSVGAVPTAATTGGTTPFHLIAANSNNSTLVGSAGAHVVYGAQFTNNSATIAYAKLYDKATAPTCGTDTPIATLIIPGAATGGAGSNIDFGAAGLGVTLGLGLCVVTGIADSDNTSVAASAYAINLSYK